MEKDIKDVCLAGDRIYLRSLTKKDINKRYLAWVNDPEVTRYLEAGRSPVSKRGLEDFYKKISKNKNAKMFAIVTKRRDIHIGNIKLGGINWIHKFADLGIMIGEKKYWGRGYGQEACGLLLEYAFKKLNLNKVILGVHAAHEPAIKAYHKAGFQIEGRLKKMLYLDGRYVDKVIMGISRTDYEKDKRHF